MNCIESALISLFSPPPRGYPAFNIINVCRAFRPQFTPLVFEKRSRGQKTALWAEAEMNGAKKVHCGLKQR